MKPEEQSTSVFLPQTCACPISSLTPKIASTFSLLATTNWGLSAFAFNKLNAFCKSLSHTETDSIEVIKYCRTQNFPSLPWHLGTEPQNTSRALLTVFPTQGMASAQSRVDTGTWEAQLSPKVTQRVSSEIQRIKDDFTEVLQEFCHHFRKRWKYSPSCPDSHTFPL